jgi:hypothetical protein
VEDIIALIGDKCDGVIGQVMFNFMNEFIFKTGQIMIFFFFLNLGFCVVVFEGC